MAIRPIYSVHCDGCSQWVAQEPTRGEAWKAAQRVGWTRRPGQVRELCPACSSKTTEQVLERDGEATLARARAFAVGVRADLDPDTHSVRLAAADAVLVRFEYSDLDLRTAACLHDVAAGPEQEGPFVVGLVRGRFGDRVADLVWAVTEHRSGNASVNRRKTFHKLHSRDGAIQIRLAVWIAEVEEAASRGERLEAYRKNQATLEGMFWSRGRHDPMWMHLRSLLGEGS